MASQEQHKQMVKLHGELSRHLPQATNLRHMLHQNPHISGEEGPTADIIVEALDAQDSPDVAGGRVIRKAAPGPVVALRAELDALPITEQTDISWKSTNGAMHACGHDIHLAALVAATRTLEALNYPVVAVLQPREETVPGGAADMLNTGALSREEVCAVIGVHVQPQLQLGSFSAAPGVVNAASDEFTIVVSGHAGHGAYPHTTRDPVVAAASVVTALQHVVSRGVSPMNPAVVGIGSIHGGTAPNAIPSEVTLTGTARSYEADDRHHIKSMIESIARNAAAMHDCTVTLDYRLGEPPLRNDSQIATDQSELAMACNLQQAPAMRSCGADDFAFFAEAFPSVMSFLGVSDGNPDFPGLHSSRFLPPDSVIQDVALLMLAGYLAARNTTLHDLS